jgi:two-component system response regulator MprA
VSKTVLLVDDDPAVRESLRRVLESEEYEVTLASNGKEALARVFQVAPDLVLLDLNIPAQNGWEVLRRIRGVHPALPVIIITARPNQQDEAAAYRANSLMEKPLDLPVLLESIAALIDQAQRPVESPTAGTAR